MAGIFSPAAHFSRQSSLEPRVLQTMTYYQAAHYVLGNRMNRLDAAGPPVESAAQVTLNLKPDHAGGVVR